MYADNAHDPNNRRSNRVLCRSRSPGLDIEFVDLLALQADPVAVAGRACAQFRGDHRHATGRADRWMLLIHVRSLPSANGRPPKRGWGRPPGQLPEAASWTVTGRSNLLVSVRVRGAGTKRAGRQLLRRAPTNPLLGLTADELATARPCSSGLVRLRPSPACLRDGGSHRSTPLRASPIG
jgi:hypothetical protein